ncbi:MAG TPA: hypothetical protein VF469_16965 [Kofleriaceae bacterium]
MANQDDVRRIALALPGVAEGRERFGFSVDHKGKARGFVWVWMERIHLKKPRVPQPAVLAARVADQTEKATLLAADPDAFFTEPHYNGFPAVLVRLANITEPVLRRVVTEAWRCMAPPDLVAAHDASDAQAAPAPTARRAKRVPARPGNASISSRTRRRSGASPRVTGKPRTK